MIRKSIIVILFIQEEYFLYSYFYINIFAFQLSRIIFTNNYFSEIFKYLTKDDYAY